MMPAEIGEYLLIRPLGSGGMGEVFLARDRTLDRLVAIKVIGGFADHPEARARFAIEARAIARLKHPNVVTVYRSGELDGRPYLVSEHVEGTSLDRLPRPVPRDRALEIGLGLARGLAAAHRQGVLHRDVKPANAILDSDGIVKLLDFGLAKLDDASVSGVVSPAPPPSSGGKTPAPEPRANAARGLLSTIAYGTGDPAASGDSQQLTLAGSQLGTPRYMSPEAWLGERVTAASDVYSLGLVLWELLADRHPFEGLDSQQLEARACGEDVPPIGAAAEGLPPALAAVIDRCGRRAQDARFPDAGALLVALEASMAVTPPPPARRGRVWIAGGLAAIAIAAVIVVVATRGSGSAAPPAPAPAAPPAMPIPRVLTALGGCADHPSFLDETTIVFGQTQGEAVDIVTTTGDGTSRTVAAGPGWDWRPTGGRHRGEILYTRDGDDNRQQLVAFDRASSLSVPIGSAYAMVAVGDVIYFLSDDTPGEISRLDAAGLGKVVALPPGKTPNLIAGVTGRLAIVIADRERPPGLCIVELADGSVRCPPTHRMLDARPALTQDGKLLYYAAATGIRRLELDGDRDELVVPGVSAPGGLALSPDARRLIYSDCASFGSIVAVGGGEPEVLVTDGRSRHPAAGPGGMLAWIAPRADGGTRLLVRAPAGTPREVASSEGELGRAAFSPGGERVAFSVVGDEGGLRAVALTGGPPIVWTRDAGDRSPVWTADGGLAFTRLGAGGVPTVVHVAAPGAPPRMLAEGWTVEDIDRAADAVLVNQNGGALGLLAVATGVISPVSLGEVGKSTILSARLAPDGRWLVVVGGVDGSTLYRVERPGGEATIVHRIAGAQTAGPPTVLTDGRIAFRPALWLGELYELAGAWARR